MASATNDGAPVGRGAGVGTLCADREVNMNQCSTAWGARRRRPPYAARLTTALADPASWPGRPGTSADGTAVTIWALAGPDAWEVARIWSETSALFVLAPPAEPPEVFDWSSLAGHPPVLIRGELPAAEVGRLAAVLLRDGAGRVLAPGGRLYIAGEAR
jgi:hypothetical protein